ncbi:endopeptidase La [Helicobacter sp. 11S02629-2]|uniref:endopeptidase La n=1 Tax=Helicobacter sp. 11S02629-2 TaxID=1476195 RepID=UPI000BA7DFB7|nr:endopeptidase La [Helicobacter sp. 11S02629-2]PAF44096.1 endopeptidase La [Helicobacter sp. 11S02629-2]
MDSKILEKLPLIIEHEMFIFPFMITPIFVIDKSGIKGLKDTETDGLCFVVCGKNNPKAEELPFYDVGVIGRIMRKSILQDGRIKLLFQGLSRGKFLGFSDASKEKVDVQGMSYKPYDPTRIHAMSNILFEKVNALAHISQVISPDLLRNIEESEDVNKAIDLICAAIRPKKEQSYQIFASDDIEERLMLLTQLVSEEIETQKLQREIKAKVHTKMDQVNKEYFLREQLKQIQKELGVDKQKDEEIDAYLKKLEALKSGMSEDVYKEIKKQITRLSRMNPDGSDANVVQNYIEWVLEIPFTTFNHKKLSISNVEKQLNADHYSLKEPKERIVEYFAVKELLQKRSEEEAKEKDSKETKQQSKELKKDEAKGDDFKYKGTILCFYGPPGVGKTSLANSIALAIGRPLVRIALGGLEDVNELRGHRRTYLGSMPGRIVQGLIDAKSMNPVMVLDEIDKIMRGVRGDPTSVLLEVLDPEQNISFRDYYTNFNIDLSSVVFIATANDISAIPAPLRDRMEFIQISSYTPQEKFEIAKKYLIPQETKKHGLKPSEVKIQKDALELIIQNYTREAGVRNLRRSIANIMRKVAVQLLEKKATAITIGVKDVPNYLKKSVFEIQKTNPKPKRGVVNGLAWTSVGGDVLTIEAIKLIGKGDLKLTGSLGDVMKESAQIAYSLIKSKLDSMELEKSSKKAKTLESKDEKETSQKSKTNNIDIHLHVPEGATPKDGPSAGITMASAIASILFGKDARQDIAMTGELTLSGEVLPIGGLKEKLIAAHKAGIKKVLIPKKNYEKDLDEIPKEVLDNLEIVPVSSIDEVLKEILINK